MNLILQIKDQIFVPYLNKCEDKEIYIDLFNKLFEDYNVSCSLDGSTKER